MMRSLYGKLVAITALIMLFSGLLAFLGINTYYHQYLKGSNDEKNMKIAESLVTFIDENPSLSLNDYLETQASAGYKLYLVDEQHQGMFFGEPFRVENLPKEAIEDVFNGVPYHGMADLPSETFVTGFFSNELKNTVGLKLQYEGQNYALFIRPDIKLLFSEIHYILAGLLLLMGTLSLLSMLIVAKKLIDPITELTIATENVGEEKFTGQLPVNRRDEIGQLANSFETMMQKLSENDRIRKEFISDVSHDFQSPLLNMKGYAELLLKEDLEVAERIQYAGVIRSETDRLSLLAKQLLLLTSLDQLSSPLVKKEVRMDHQLKEVIRKYHWKLAEKGVSLSMSLDEVTMEADPNFLDKVWDNLVSNAVKYTNEGMIDIELTETVEAIVVEITDTGIGMREDQLTRIYDRFYRVDDSRTHEVNGTGLGLAIVAEVIELHGGIIQVKSEIGIGTTFTVTFPKL